MVAPSRPGFEHDGLTVAEVALLCFRKRKTIYNLLYRYKLPVQRIWVPVEGAPPLMRRILLLPPATVSRLRRLTRDRVR